MGGIANRRPGETFSYSFSLRNDSARTVNNVVIPFVFICSLTVILYLSDLHVEVDFPALGLLLCPVLSVTLHPWQLLAQSVYSRLI